MAARTYLLLPVGLGLIGVLGCATLPSLPPGNAEGGGGTAKRQPRPSTLVAYGELHEKAATDAGRSPAEQGELRNKARLAYQQALLLNPNDRLALMALARLYATEGDYERAVSTYTRAIQAYPNDAELRYELGMCHGRCKNWDGALQSLQKAVQADPENRHYGHAYGLCLARAQRYDESFAVLAKLEGGANAYYDLARMLHHLGQDDASKEHLRLALGQNPDLIAAQQLLAALEAGTADQADPIFAAAQSPNSRTAPAMLGRPVRVVGPQGAEAPQAVLPASFNTDNR
jgi:tetratricopeptide (TPR) repeat protein